MATQKKAFKWDPDYWVKQGLPRAGAFGCLDGHLILGSKHHQLIMAALVKKGWTFGQMMSVHQAWGWWDIKDPRTYSRTIMNDPYFKNPDYGYFYKGLPQGHRGYLWPFINISFSSDAGVMDQIGVNQAKQAFQTMYRLPVQIGAGEIFGGVANPENYGAGLAGAGNINKYLDEDSTFYHLTDDIQNVPDPPPDEPWNDRDAARLEKLQRKQALGLTLPEQNELLQLWMKQQEHQMQVQAFFKHISKLASQNYKFVWADGIFEVAKGFYKDLHHYNLLSNIVSKLGGEPQNYVAGDYTQDAFHPQFGTVTIRWHRGKAPSPADLKDMMQRYITHLSV